MRGNGFLAAAFALSAAAWPGVASAQTLQPPPPMQPVQPWGAPAPAWGATRSAAPPGVLAAEQADSGRGFELVWVNAEAGGGFVNVGKDLGLRQSSGGTGLFGVGVGVRFVVWTLGARVRLLPSSAFTLYEINGELGFHLPLGSWDPYLSLHGGYVTSSLNGDAAPEGFPVPHGFDLGLSVGDDYYFTPLFSVGLDATLDALFLKRGDFQSTVETAQAPGGSAVVSPSVIVATGSPAASSTGFALVGSLHAGLHFDL